MQLTKNLKNKKSWNFQLSFVSFILAIILGIALFFILAENFKAYQSTVSIIFIPRNEKTVGETEFILENITKIPRMLSFYEKMISENPDVADNFASYEKDKKKKKWNNILAAERENGSSVVNLEISGRDSSQTEKMALATARTLFQSVSFYYNIKNDVDFRIIDGPISRGYISHWPALTVAIIIFILVASFFLEKISLKISDVILTLLPKTKKRVRLVKKMPSLEKFERPLPKKIEGGETEGWMKKSAAPGNLPVFPEEIPKMTEEEMEYRPEAEKAGVIPLAEETPEPTEKELKKRLNQLLRGEL